MLIKLVSKQPGISLKKKLLSILKKVSFGMN